MEMIYVGLDTPILTSGDLVRVDINNIDASRPFVISKPNIAAITRLNFKEYSEKLIHPSHYKPEPKQEPQDLFQVVDVVYHWHYGSGKISRIDKDSEYSIIVNFETLGECSFTKDGRFRKEQEPSLSFTPYNFKDGGFSQERPKSKPKVGDYGWFWGIEPNISTFTLNRATFGELTNIASGVYYNNKVHYPNFSHEAPPHIAKHLKKAQTATSSPKII
jgi:hypothetical protein